MPVYRSMEDVYDRCVGEGMLNPQEQINTDRVKSMLKIADEDLEGAKDLLKMNRWNSSYKLHYDALHALVEALLLFDHVKSSNHQCLFTHLCIKHPELDLSWEFFERIRMKRNGIHYYGQAVHEKDWKEIVVQMHLYLQALKRAVEKRI